MASHIVTKQTTLTAIRRQVMFIFLMLKQLSAATNLKMICEVETAERDTIADETGHCFLSTGNIETCTAI
jgi:hypothetical protein